MLEQWGCNCHLLNVKVCVIMISEENKLNIQHLNESILNEYKLHLSELVSHEKVGSEKLSDLFDLSSIHSKDFIMLLQFHIQAMLNNQIVKESLSSIELARISLKNGKDSIYKDIQLMNNTIIDDIIQQICSTISDDYKFIHIFEMLHEALSSAMNRFK